MPRVSASGALEVTITRQPGMVVQVGADRLHVTQRRRKRSRTAGCRSAGAGAAARRRGRCPPRAPQAHRVGELQQAGEHLLVAARVIHGDQRPALGDPGPRVAGRELVLPTQDGPVSTATGLLLPWYRRNAPSSAASSAVRRSATPAGRGNPPPVTTTRPRPARPAADPGTTTRTAAHRWRPRSTAAISI